VVQVKKKILCDPQAWLVNARMAMGAAGEAEVNTHFVGRLIRSLSSIHHWVFDLFRPKRFLDQLSALRVCMPETVNGLVLITDHGHRGIPADRVD
jgi:hypothetical protein